MQHRGDPVTSARDEHLTSAPQSMNEPKEPHNDELA
jgi:hypothetical protein